MVKTKLQDFKGMDTGKEFVEKAERLESLVGIPRRNPFGVRSEAELAQKIDNMTITQLKTMCIDIGVMASGSLPNLKRRILAEYKKFNKAKMIVVQSSMAQEILENS
jgi:hypothetical protein